MAPPDNRPLFRGWATATIAGAAVASGEVTSRALRSTQSWPQNPPRSLGALAARLDDDLATEVRGLERILYAPGQSTVWQGEGLWRAWHAARLDREAGGGDNRPGETIAPLYPG